MKKTILSIAAISIFALALSSCRDGETEVVEKETTVIKEVPAETNTQTQPERKGILERAASKADQEINKEIDQEIDKIGDDN